MPLLDLSNADDSAKFNPLPEGTYRAHIVSADMVEAKGGGKLPEGTPQIRVRFEIHEDEVPEPTIEVDEETGKERKVPFSKTVFSYYSIPDKKYENADTMYNILYGFLKAVGYDVKELKSGKFKLEPEDLQGRKCLVNLTIREYTPPGGETRLSNNVKYVKAADSSAALI